MSLSPIRKPLKQLLPADMAAGLTANPLVSDITLDSRSLVPGALFIAIHGETNDGRDFIEEAIARGAVAVLYEQYRAEIREVDSYDIPLVAISGLRAKVGEIAAAFFDFPTDKMKVVGVTGTNGKTTTTHLLASLLEGIGKRAGLVGTLGVGELDNMQPIRETTPSAIDLQRYAAEFLQAGVEVMVMEVSSHGIAQERVAGINFHTLVLTNITRDHLDYHDSYQAYRNVKLSLFSGHANAHVVVNLNDPAANEITSISPPNREVRGFLLSSQHDSAVALDEACVNVIRGVSLHHLAQGIEFTLTGGGDEACVRSSLLGSFNASNILAALAAIDSLGFSIAKAVLKLREYQSPPGRLEEIVTPKNSPIVIVDYAHTPDAFESVCQGLKSHFKRDLLCVFGCGGNRDQGKRPEMGRIAETECKKIFLTDDNPRTESGEEIIDGIMSGITVPSKVTIIRDRTQAIHQALNVADEDEIVLIAGKGHEQIQELDSGIIKHSDRDVVETYYGASNVSVDLV